MARTFSRLFIVQAAIASLFSFSAVAKVTPCEAILLTSDSPSVFADIIQGRIEIGVNESGRPAAIFQPELARPGIEDRTHENTLLWLINGTANLDAMPRKNDVEHDGKVWLAFPVELPGPRSFRILFRYSQTYQGKEPRIGVLDKIEIVDAYGFEVKVKPSLEDLIWKVSHGPHHKIYGISVAGTMIPFKSHLLHEELDEYKAFFLKFLEYPTNLRGKLRDLDDISGIGTAAELRKKMFALKIQNKVHWWIERGKRNGATILISSLGTLGTLSAYNYLSSNFAITPKTEVTQNLTVEKADEPAILKDKDGKPLVKP